MLATAAVISVVFFVALVAWTLVAPPEREERLARRPEAPSAASDCLRRPRQRLPGLSGGRSCGRVPARFVAGWRVTPWVSVGVVSASPSPSEGCP